MFFDFECKRFNEFTDPYEMDPFEIFELLEEELEELFEEEEFCELKLFPD